MSNPASTDDAEQIGRVMQTYIEGGRTGNIDTLRPIFHELATICGYVGPDLFAGPIEMFYDWHAENGPAADLVDPLQPSMGELDTKFDPIGAVTPGFLPSCVMR